MNAHENGEATTWLLPSQVAERLGISISRVNQLLRQGRLPCLRLLGTRLVDAEAVRRFQAEREAQPVQKQRAALMPR